MVDAQPGNFSLSCEQLVCIDRPCGEARFAEGVITLLADHVSAGIGHDTGGAEMIFQDVVECTINSHRAAGVVGHGAGGTST